MVKTPLPEGVAALRATVRGLVMVPGDTSYLDECRAFNLLRTPTPAVAVGASCTDDVLVRFAADRGMPIAVRNRGHQVVLPVGDDAMLITTNRLHEIAVDTEHRTVRVGAGVTWSEVLEETDKVGLAPIVGSAPNVGVVGYTLGGGLSPLLGRKLGYAADHVRWIEVVTADGTLREVTSRHEPEFFRALLGGKGHFGDYVTGPRIITDATKAEMKKVLAEIQDGTFARNWMEEYHSGLKKYNEYKKQDAESLLETTGKKLRKLMSWVEAVDA